jgi:hypothetical protein
MNNSTKTVHNFLDTRIYVNEQNKLESDVYSCQLVGRGGQILTGRGGGGGGGRGGGGGGGGA